MAADQKGDQDPIRKPAKVFAVAGHGVICAECLQPVEVIIEKSLSDHALVNCHTCQWMGTLPKAFYDVVDAIYPTGGKPA